MPRKSLVVPGAVLVSWHSHLLYLIFRMPAARTLHTFVEYPL